MAENLISEADAVLEVRELIVRGDIESVKQALERADRLGIHNDELEMAREACRVREEATEANKELLACMRTGGVNDWKHQYVDSDSIDKALAKALEYEWNTPKEDLLLSAGAVLRDLRLALKKESWDDVGVLVSAALRLEMKQPEVFAAKDKLEYRLSVIKAAEQCETAADSRDPAAIEEALRSAERLKMTMDRSHWQVSTCIGPKLHLSKSHFVRPPHGR